ncbi:hypothetical protein [Spiroplasma endosymbiont of Polydrusus formosus]
MAIPIIAELVYKNLAKLSIATISTHGFKSSPVSHILPKNLIQLSIND